MKKGILFFYIFLIAVGCKTSKKAIQETPKVDAPQKVERPLVNSIVGKYNFVDSSSAKVFLKTHITHFDKNLTLPQLNESFKVQWSLQTDAGIKEKLNSGKLAFTADYAIEEDGFQYLSFDIPRIREQESAILLVELIHPSSGTKFSYDLTIDFSAKRSNTRYEVYKDLSSSIPNFTPYVLVNESFVIKSIQPSDEPLFLIRYRNNSKPALSPMSGTKRDVTSEFEIAETIEVDDRKPLSLKETGLYVLTQDPSNVKDGYGFLVADSRYPRDTNPESLKEALVYMSTSKEAENITGFASGKDGMDMYFLNLAKGDQNLAKKIIRTYYTRIEEANKIFTNYKEGWKTDKGMVYVIMGPPARVQRNRQREVWLYSQNRNTSEIIYTFYKKPNVFSDQNYELVRYPEYSAFWYPYVEAWRTGKVTESFINP